uniref:Uncharacterized protein n=1 Tax=Romanomermis culicivorax TaxID=13658 RepID=A0A915J774_ROMCU
MIDAAMRPQRYSKQIVLVSVSIFTSLIAVIIFVVCWQRRRARKQLRRAMEREMARRGSLSSASSSTAGGDGSRSSLHLTTAVPGQQSCSMMNRQTSQKAEPSSPHEKLVKSDSRTSEVGHNSKKNHLPRNEAGEIVVFPQNRYASKKGKSKDSTNVEMITFPDIEEELKSLTVGVCGRRTSHQPAVRPISPKLLSKISHKFKSFHEEEMNNNNNNGDDAETSFSVTERKDYSSVKSKVPYKYPASNKLPKIKILNTSDHNSIWQERRRSSDIRSTGSSSLGGGSGIQNLTPDSEASDLSPALTSPLWKDFTTDSKGTSELNVIRRRINSNAPFNPTILFSIPSESKSPLPSPSSGAMDNENPADTSGQDAFCPRPPPTPLDLGTDENLSAKLSSKTIVKLPPGILKQSNLTTITPNTACSNKPELSTYRSMVTVDIPRGYSTTKRTFFGPSPQPSNKGPTPTFPKPILSMSKSLDVAAAGKFTFANYPKITRQKAVEFSDQIQSQIIEGSPSSDLDDSTPEQMPAVCNSTTTTPSSDNSGPWRQRIKPTIV